MVRIKLGVTIMQLEAAITLRNLKCTENFCSASYNQLFAIGMSLQEIFYFYFLT